MDLGQTIQRLRTRAGLTQSQLAHKARIDSSSLSRIERGQIPSDVTLVKLELALETKPQRLTTIANRERRARMQEAG